MIKHRKTWKGEKPNCLDCGKHLSEHKCKRCKSCAHKGKLNHAYKGKVKRQCNACRKDFYVFPAHIKRGGIFCSDICRLKILNENQKGEKNRNWKGGIYPINKLIRASLEFKLWRKAVFERDNYTCVWCSQYGGVLNADHIKPFADYPELRFAIDNGRTLCVSCHKKTNTWGKH
jgi:5-methylcytosine-specific restriction endonuclease McrA